MSDVRKRLRSALGYGAFALLVVYTVIASLNGAEEYSDFASDFAIFVSELGEFAVLFAGISFIWFMVASTVERAKQSSHVSLVKISLANLFCSVLLLGLLFWATWMPGWRRDWVGGEILGFLFTLTVSVTTIYFLKRKIFNWIGLTFARPAWIAVVPLAVLITVPLIGGFLYIVGLAAGYHI